jgi:hypothetical protein
LRAESTAPTRNPTGSTSIDVVGNRSTKVPEH